MQHCCDFGDQNLHDLERNDLVERKANYILGLFLKSWESKLSQSKIFITQVKLNITQRKIYTYIKETML